MTGFGVVVDDSSAGQGSTCNYRPGSPLRPERFGYRCAGRDLPSTGLTEMGAVKVSNRSWLLMELTPFPVALPSADDGLMLLCQMSGRTSVLFEKGNDLEHPPDLRPSRWADFLSGQASRGLS